MFIYLAGVGLMERGEFIALERGVQKYGRGKIGLPPHCPVDLPQGVVAPLATDVETFATDLLCEALGNVFRRDGSGGGSGRPASKGGKS